MGDSFAVLGLTKKVFENCGVKEVCQEENVRLINFDTSLIVKKKMDGEILKEIFLPQEVLEIDLLLSLPKHKTHNFMFFTGALKNQLGIIPGALKPKIHQMAPNIIDFSKALVDINLAVKFNLAVMEGIIGLEGAILLIAVLEKSKFCSCKF